MHYETCHDKMSSLAKENKDLMRRVTTQTTTARVERRGKDIITNMVKKFQRDRTLRCLERCYSELKLNAFNKYRRLYFQISENTAYGERAA